MRPRLVGATAISTDEAIAEARALEVEVGLGHLQLVGQRHELLLPAPQDVAEDLRQPLDARLRPSPVAVDQLRDGVQGC
jgi:hypothetical protein